MFDLSKSHREAVYNRIDDLEKTLQLNVKAIEEYGEFMTDEHIGIIRSQNALIDLEIAELKKEIGVE